MTTQEFIIKNLDLLDDYDLTPVWTKIAEKKFRQETGHYITSDRNTFILEDFGFRYRAESYDELLTAWSHFKNWTGLSSKELKEKDCFQSLSNSYNIWITKQYQFKTSSDFSLNYVISLIIYVLTGNLPEDFGPSNKICDGLGIHYDSPIKNLELLGLPKQVYMTRFQNGKITFKGLSEQDWSEVERIVALCQRNFCPNQIGIGFYDMKNNKGVSKC
jgi:hypothetical protein